MDGREKRRAKSGGLCSASLGPFSGPSQPGGQVPQALATLSWRRAPTTDSSVPQRFSLGEAGVTPASTTVSEAPTHPASPNLTTVPPDTPRRRDSEAPARAIGSRGAEQLLEIRGANANSVPLPREGLLQMISPSSSLKGGAKPHPKWSL